MDTNTDVPAALATNDIGAAKLTRIKADYREMPGLCLTVQQGARLWNLNANDCADALQRLVADGFLTEGRRGYVRAGS